MSDDDNDNDNPSSSSNPGSSSDSEEAAEVVVKRPVGRPRGSTVAPGGRKKQIRPVYKSLGLPDQYSVDMYRDFYRREAMRRKQTLWYINSGYFDGEKWHSYRSGYTATGAHISSPAVYSKKIRETDIAGTWVDKRTFRAQITLFHIEAPIELTPIQSSDDEKSSSEGSSGEDEAPPTDTSASDEETGEKLEKAVEKMVKSRKQVVKPTYKIIPRAPRKPPQVTPREDNIE